MFSADHICHNWRVWKLWTFGVKRPSHGKLKLANSCCKLKLVCVNSIKTVGKHVSIWRQQFANVFATCFCAVHTYQLGFANAALDPPRVAWFYHAFTWDQQNWLNFWMEWKCASMAPSFFRSQTCTPSRSKVSPVPPVRFSSMQKFVGTHVNGVLVLTERSVASRKENE